MSEHWKSTPRYWCKHCSCYVRDTKLERQNHEATARHHSALKRFLRDLHRGHDREEREKQRARQEIARLNGVVAGVSPSSNKTAPNQRDSQVESKVSASQTQKQLAELGVSIPSDFRPDMAMPGEWTVTNTRILEPTTRDEPETKLEARATGVRKRELKEGEAEEEEAIQGLFKKPRKWGRDSKAIPEENDAELEMLLTRPLAPRKQVFDDTFPTKQESHEDAPEETVKPSEKCVYKNEPDEDIAQSKTDAPEIDGVTVEEEDTKESPTAPIVFRKRRIKDPRQK